MEKSMVPSVRRDFVCSGHVSWQIILSSLLFGWFPRFAAGYAAVGHVDGFLSCRPAEGGLL